MEDKTDETFSTCTSSVNLDDDLRRSAAADQGGFYVKKWGSEGATSGKFHSQFNFPRSVAFDSNGVMYVADSYNHRIQKFAYGYYVGEWGGFGSAPGQFYYPSGVAVTNGGCAIVVSDGLNHRVQKFACDNSRFRLRWGGQGIANGEFNRPRGIALDGSGNVYVADTNNHRIQKFTSTGAFLLKGGGPGPEDGKFNRYLST